MSNTFEFAERLGFDPPIQFQQDRKGFYEGVINYRDLFEFIAKGVNDGGETEPFDYLNFKSTSIRTVSASEQQEMFQTKDFLTFRDKEYPVNVPYETETPTGDKISLEPITRLNKKIAKVNTTPDHAIFFDFKKEKVYFVLAYRYINSNETAIEIRCQFFDQFETIMKLSGYRISDADLEEDLIKNYNRGFAKAGQDPNELDWIYEAAPIFIMVSRGAKQLTLDLSIILRALVDEIGVNEEKVVLKLLNALAIIHITKNLQGVNFLGNGADTLLKTLITSKVDKETLFERLYDKMNDKGFGEENFTRLMLFLYNIWLFSSWSNSDAYIDGQEAGPQNIAYTNKKILGFYQNGFDFNFVEENGLKIKVTRKEKQGGSFKSGAGRIVTKTVGVYHPFEPLRMPEIPEKGELKIDKTIIPAFYLKAFDDKAAWSNFETGSWLVLDIVSTITGVGNILKFRHLTKLARLAKTTKGVVNADKVARAAKVSAGIKLFAGVVEFANGTISALITLSQTDSKFAIALQKYLFYLELLTITGELTVALKGGLKRYAREAVAQSDDAIRKAYPEVFKYLDDIWTENIKEFIELSKELARVTKNKTLVQSSNVLDELYDAAKVADKELRGITDDFAKKTNGEAGYRDGLKGRDRAVEKIDSDYGGDVSRLVDISGSKVVYSKVEDLYKSLEKFHKEHEILKLKDRIQKPINGYRDILMNIKMKNGHIVEFRLHLKEMDEIADKIGHKLYEKQRSIEAISKTRKLTKEEKIRIFELKNQQFELYEEAWRKTLNN